MHTGTPSANGLYVQPQLDSSPRPMMILASQTDQVSSAGAHVLVQNSGSTSC